MVGTEKAFTNLLKGIRRRLRLSPMQQVLRELKKRDVRLKDLDALEVFGGSGDFHTKDYASRIPSLEVWEIDPKYGKSLKRNLPMAEVRITDSYEEIKNTSKRYSLIVVDNPMSTYDNHCEHFDLFPYVFRIAKDSTILILNVIPEIDDIASRKYPYLFNEVQLERRKSFYKTNRPENVPFDRMEEVYRNLILTNGFSLEWFFFQKRNLVYYLVLKIRKTEVNTT